LFINIGISLLFWERKLLSWADSRLPYLLMQL